MRETCLDTRPARSLRLPSIDPVLLRQLAGMGNNLNQIARKINGGQWSGCLPLQRSSSCWYSPSVTRIPKKRVRLTAILSSDIRKM